MADDDASSDTDGGLGGDKKDTPAQKKQVKNEHILIAVGIITLLVMYVYMRKSAASSSGSNSVANSPYGVNSYGSSQDPYGYGNDINTLASDMQSMQSEIAGLTPPTTSSGSTTPSGGMIAGVVGSGAGQFTEVPNPQANQNLAAAGATQYTEPVPGDFIPVPVNTNPSNVNPGGNPNANPGAGVPTYILNP